MSAADAAVDRFVNAELLALANTFGGDRPTSVASLDWWTRDRMRRWAIDALDRLERGDEVPRSPLRP